MFRSPLINQSVELIPIKTLKKQTALISFNAWGGGCLAIDLGRQQECGSIISARRLAWMVELQKL